MMFKNMTGFPAAIGSLWGDIMNTVMGMLSSHVGINVISDVYPFDFDSGYGADGDAQINPLTGEYACKNNGVWTAYAARKGVIAYRVSPAKLYANTGSAWVDASSGGGGAVDTLYTADGDIQSTRLIGLNGNTITFRQTYSGKLYDTGIGGDGFYASGQEDLGALGSTYYSFFAGAGLSYYANIISSAAEGSRQHIAIFKNEKVTENFEGTISQVQSIGGDIETYPHDVGAGVRVGKEGELISYANSSQDGGIYTQIREYPTETIIDSNFNSYEGFKYANDHSANFTASSLINLGYADATYLKIADAVSTPTGSVSAFAGAAAPAGWLFCDGSDIDRTTYAALFAAIGTDYGVGDGSTTFTLPDLRGEFVRGLDAGRGIDTGRVLGSFQFDELKAHTHSYTETTQATDTQSGGDTYYIDAAAGTTGSTGGTETRPRNIAMHYMIKT